MEVHLWGSQVSALGRQKVAIMNHDLKKVAAAIALECVDYRRFIHCSRWIWRRLRGDTFRHHQYDAVLGIGGGTKLP
jgi:hypothetical protein